MIDADIVVDEDGEATVLANTRKQASRLGFRLLRNNRGQFYTMDKKRIVRAGLEAPGSSDLIGPIPVVITEEMVGMTVGFFAAVEVKEPEWKRNPKDLHENTQAEFIENVEKFGGLGFFLKNHEELAEKVAGSLKRAVDRHRKNV